MLRYAQQVQSIDKSLAMHYALLGTLTDTKIDILPFIGSDYEYWFGRIKVDGTREAGKLDAFKGLLTNIDGRVDCNCIGTGRKCA